MGLVEAREHETVGTRQEIPLRRFIDFAREDDAVPQIEFAREPFERSPFAAIGSDEDDGACPIAAEAGDRPEKVVRGLLPLEASQEHDEMIDVEPLSGAFRGSRVERLRVEAGGQDVNSVPREAAGLEPSTIRPRCRHNRVHASEGPPTDERIVEPALHARAQGGGGLSHSMVERVDHRG